MVACHRRSPTPPCACDGGPGRRAPEAAGCESLACPNRRGRSVRPRHSSVAAEPAHGAADRGRDVSRRRLVPGADHAPLPETPFRRFNCPMDTASRRGRIHGRHRPPAPPRGGLPFRPPRRRAPRTLSLHPPQRLSRLAPGRAPLSQGRRPRAGRPKTLDHVRNSAELCANVRNCAQLISPTCGETGSPRAPWIRRRLARCRRTQDRTLRVDRQDRLRPSPPGRADRRRRPGGRQRSMLPGVSTRRRCGTGGLSGNDGGIEAAGTGLRVSRP